VELYFRSPVCLDGVVLNKVRDTSSWSGTSLSTGAIYFTFILLFLFRSYFVYSYTFRAFVVVIVVIIIVVIIIIIIIIIIFYCVFVFGLLYYSCLLLVFLLFSSILTDEFNRIIIVTVILTVTVT
jgi:hypothetical protein